MKQYIVLYGGANMVTDMMTNYINMPINILNMAIAAAKDPTQNTTED